ncbi:MAG: hypothetical protein H0U75_02730 [Legionella sp.]|nr:hypothetical protein [Legionella sp.]
MLEKFDDSLSSLPLDTLKPYFCIDLDCTCLIGEQEVGRIDLAKHILSDFIEVIGGFKRDIFKVALINPERLRRLLEKAETLAAGFIFLTKSTWDEATIKQGLISTLHLSPKASFMIQKARFINIILIKQYFPEEIPTWQLFKTTKDLWLLQYLEVHIELSLHHFVVLDDDPTEVNALNKLKNVIAITATTHIGQALRPHAFYQLTIDALKHSVSSTKKYIFGNDTPLEKTSKADSSTLQGQSSFYVPCFPKKEESEIKIHPGFSP